MGREKTSMSSPAPAPTNVISMSRAGISLASAPPISPPIKPSEQVPDRGAEKPGAHHLTDEARWGELRDVRETDRR